MSTFDQFAKFFHSYREYLE